MQVDRYRSLFYQTIQTIQKSNRVLLISHPKPDGDTAGSVLAIAHFLDAINAQGILYCKDLPGAHYEFLPGIQRFTNDVQRILDGQPYDCVIVCDAGDLGYAGVERWLPTLSGAPTIINIDHHRTNTHFGHLNIVVEDAAATAEVVAQLFMTQGITITPEMALCLLTGIMTDTGTFTNPATSSSALETAAALIRVGAPYRLLIQKVVMNRRLNSFRLLADVLQRLEVKQPWGLGVTVMTLEDQERYAVDEESTEGIANFLNSLSHEQAHATLVLKQLPGDRIKGSLRTTREDIDVSAFAKLLGGGGHKKAAGFTIDGQLVQEDGQWRIR
ncbi:DHH family phosphoesterase [Candidatus Uhrbacteria bacterium]|nr:DHH family phosphoesterase [Candidatus Uhrbacteria bacterium]